MLRAGRESIRASFSYLRYRPNWIKRGHFYVIIAIIDGARL